MNLLDLAREAAAAQNCHRLLRVRVEYGAIAGIMPDALSFCFNTLTRGTSDEGAQLELICLPLRLRCPLCGAIFGGENQASLWEPCPKCGEILGHIVEQGRELTLARVEALPD